MRMYLSDICTVSVNLAGLPAMSVPCGLTREGLPVGVQFIGNYFRENDILRAGYTFEQVRGDWRTEPAKQSKCEEKAKKEGQADE